MVKQIVMELWGLRQNSEDYDTRLLQNQSIQTEFIMN